MHIGYPPKALRMGFGVECIATIDASGRHFSPRHIGANLVLDLIWLSCGFWKSCCGMWLLQN
jgi:hypothetical protein